MTPLDPSLSQIIRYPGSLEQFLERHGESHANKMREFYLRRPPQPWPFKIFHEWPVVPYTGNTHDFVRGIATQWDNRVKHLSLTDLDKTNDEGVIAALQEYPTLESLTIRSQDMTNRSAEEIAKQTHLLRLKFFPYKNCKKFRDGAALSQLTQLRELEIYGDSNLYFSRKMLAQFSHLEKLVGINLKNEEIGELVGAIPGLTSLYLPCAGHETGCVTLIAGWTNLTSLTIPRCRIAPGEISFLAERCPMLTELDIRHCSDLGNKGVIEIAKLVNLRKLQMREYDEIGSIDFTPLAGLIQLEHLCIQRSPVESDAILAFAENLHRLKHFHINSSRIDGVLSPNGGGIAKPRQIIQTIGSMTRLESLSINARGLEVDSLGRLMHLQKLKLHNAGTTPRTMELFSQNLTNLQELGLYCCRDTFPKGSNALGEPLFKRLKVLRIELTSLENIGARGLSPMPGLQGFSLSCASLKDSDIGQLAANCPGLTALDLSSNKEISNEALRLIAAGLKQLTYIDIGYNNVGDEGMEALLVGLPHLRHVRFSFTQVTDASIPRLTEKATQGLETAYEYGSEMSCEGAESLPKRLSKKYACEGKKLRPPLWSE